MWLVLQIALGILLGFILIKNFDYLISFWLRLAMALAGVIAVAAIWYAGGQLIGAVNDYQNAGGLAKSMFSAISLATFIVLGVSTLAGLWLFLLIAIPEKIINLINKSEDSNAILNVSSALLTLTILYFSANITLPGILGRFHDSWTQWGLAHGMGYDGGDFFGLLLWQLMWPINLIVLKIQKRSIATAIKGLKETVL